MQYRPFGTRWDFRVSALGFGTMRLPTIGGSVADVDEPEATRMLRHAIDAGVNYVDTAYPYHAGNSERWLGRALADGYRERVKLADKLPSWMIKSSSDFDPLLDEQMARLGTDHIDVYLLHNLQEDLWPRVRDAGALEWLDRIRAEGRVSAVGFSFHGGYDCFEEIIDAYDWHMCQIQYNYMNETVQAGTEGLQYAAGKGIAVVVMEPLLGGCLAEPPPPIREIWDAEPDVSPADAALQWLWNKPEVAAALSGMSAFEQVEHNLASAGASGVGRLDPRIPALIERAKARQGALNTIPCTRCGYCMPCPEGVDIPRNLQLYNDALTFGGNQKILNRNIYRGLRPEMAASACVECGQCEEHCPQHIEIIDALKKVDAFFTG
jgi:predicted aldo/keto reductase-like oxidoreductase